MSCNEDHLKGRGSINSYNRFGELQPYLRSFDQNYVKYTGQYLPLDDLTIEFVEDSTSDSKNWVGRCTYSSKKITVKRSYWKKINDDVKTVLVYHELGHCYLGRGHITSKTNGIPNSIMYPDTSVASYFSANKSEYIEELFTGNKALVARAIENYRYEAKSLGAHEGHRCNDEY